MDASTPYMVLDDIVPISTTYFRSLRKVQPFACDRERVTRACNGKEERKSVVCSVERIAGSGSSQGRRLMIGGCI